jgi:hypothetical protein
MLKRSGDFSRRRIAVIPAHRLIYGVRGVVVQGLLDLFSSNQLANVLGSDFCIHRKAIEFDDAFFVDDDPPRSASGFVGYVNAIGVLGFR